MSSCYRVTKMHHAENLRNLWQMITKEMLTSIRRGLQILLEAEGAWCALCPTASHSPPQSAKPQSQAWEDGEVSRFVDFNLAQRDTRHTRPWSPGTVAAGNFRWLSGG